MVLLNNYHFREQHFVNTNNYYIGGLNLISFIFDFIFGNRIVVKILLSNSLIFPLHLKNDIEEKYTDGWGGLNLIDGFCLSNLILFLFFCLEKF